MKRKRRMDTPEGGGTVGRVGRRISELGISGGRHQSAGHLRRGFEPSACDRSLAGRKVQKAHGRDRNGRTGRTPLTAPNRRGGEQASRRDRTAAAKRLRTVRPTPTDPEDARRPRDRGTADRPYHKAGDPRSGHRHEHGTQSTHEHTGSPRGRLGLEFRLGC